MWFPKISLPRARHRPDVTSRLPCGIGYPEEDSQGKHQPRYQNVGKEAREALGHDLCRDDIPPEQVGTDQYRRDSRQRQQDKSFEEAKPENPAARGAKRHSQPEFGAAPAYPKPEGADDGQENVHQEETTDGADQAGCVRCVMVAEEVAADIVVGDDAGNLEISGL